MRIKNTAPMNIHRRFLDIYGDKIVDMITGNAIDEWQQRRYIILLKLANFEQTY